MTDKLIYTASFGKGGAEFALVEGYQGRGVYGGMRRAAGVEHLERYYAQLEEDRVERPSGTVFVTLLKKVNRSHFLSFDQEGSLLERREEGVALVALVSALMGEQPSSVLASQANKNKFPRLFFVGRNHFERLSTSHTLKSTWDNERVVLDLLDIYDKEFSEYTRNWSCSWTRQMIANKARELKQRATRRVVEI